MTGKADPNGGSPAPSIRRRRNHALWLGPPVVFVGAISYFMVFARFPALRDFPWVNLPIVAIGVGLSVVGAWRAYLRPDRVRARILGAAGLSMAILLGGLFGVYIFYLSYRLPAPSEVTLSLTTAPGFTLSDHNGRPVSLADFRGRKLVVTFYRGFW